MCSPQLGKHRTEGAQMWVVWPKRGVPVYYFRGGQEGGETFAGRGRVPVGPGHERRGAH